MTAPYYADDHVTLWHGDCRDMLAAMPDRSADCVITDPPYSQNTHTNARINSTDGKGARNNHVIAGLRRDFGHITAEDLSDALTQCGRITRGWVIATLDYHHAFTYETNPPVGLRLMRLGVWLKTDPMPQISGDRPALGWETIAYLHRTDHRSTWNGGGKHGNWHGGKEQAGLHPTAKPVAMVANWVRLFTNPGDTILDPFAGSGTTLRAAKDEGRKAIGVEIDERYCEVIAKRLAQGVLDFGGVA
jgi:site-specific DNA-methyltransferase (adenine-specific)